MPSRPCCCGSGGRRAHRGRGRAPGRLPRGGDRPRAARAVGPRGADDRVHPGHADERACRRHPVVRRAARRRRQPRDAHPARACRPRATSRPGPTRRSEAERDAGRRLPGIGHRWHAEDLRAERLLEVAVDARRTAARGGGPGARRARRSTCRADPVAVNIDGALAVALDARSGSTRSTATSCSPSRGASASPPTSSRSAPGSGRCG